MARTANPIRLCSAPAWCGAAMLVISAGCTVGPDYNRPPLSVTAGYGQPAPVLLPPATAPRFSGTDVPARWWTVFRSAAIDRLVDDAVAANPDLKSAQHALRAAHELLAAQRASLFPQVGANFLASRQRNPATLASPLFSNANDFSLFTGQLSVSYAPDVFGGGRRQIEAMQAEVESQKFAVEAAYLSLTSNVVVAAIQVASLRAQIAAAQKVVRADQDILDRLSLRKSLGEASGGDLAAQETALAQANTALPPLRKALGQQEHLLAQLTGRTPAEFDLVAIDINSLRLPSELPLSLPSKLAEQRPDIRAAEENLHAASAQVGVAIAARLPNISLSAALGGTSTEIGSLLTNGNGLWSVTGGITQPIFDAGALRHTQHAAEAQFDQAKEQYRSVVLSAFQNVADVLLALEQDGAALSASLQAERAARRSLDIARLNLAQGEGNSSAVFIAVQSWQQALSALVQAQAARYCDTAGLFQALGGGWWNRGGADEAPGELAKKD